jgi:4-amino-4-deoxy-L-arabinose transferase-like glycosyltransferase
VTDQDDKPLESAARPPLGALAGLLPEGRKEWAALALVLLLGVAIRFWNLGEESFWLDEVFSARIAERPVGEILSLIPRDKPPLDYYLQAAFSRLGAEKEFLHRLPAAISSILFLACLYAWAGMIAGRRVALITTAIAAFNTFLVYYAREARPYMPYLALQTLQLCVYTAWIRGGRSPGLAAATAVLGVACVYTLYAGFIVLGVELLFLVALAARGGGWKRVATFAALAGAVVLAALPLRSRSSLYPPEDYFWTYQGPITAHFIAILQQCFHGLEKIPLLLDAMPAARLLVLGVVAWRVRRGGMMPLLPALLAVAGFLLVFLYAHINREFVVRYSIFAVPGLMLFMALGVDQGGQFAARLAGPGQGQRTAAIFTGLFLAVYALFSVYTEFSGRPRREGWKDASAMLASKAGRGESVVVPGADRRIVLEYYMRRFGRTDMPLLIMDEQSQRGGPPADWVLSPDMGEQAIDSPYYRLYVQRQSAAPPATDYREVLAQLAEPTLFPLATVPGELLGAGWSHPEHWGNGTSIRWASATEVLFFVPVAKAGAGRLVVRAMPYEFSEPPSQTIAAEWNGRALGERSFPGAGFDPIAWDIPAEDATAGYNRLVLKFGRVRVRADVEPENADFRTLAAAVEWIAWEPAD